MSDNDAHIVTSFDAELRQLDSLIAEMGGLAEAQFADALDALVRRDLDKAERVRKNDARIDAFERDIETNAVRILALRQPMAADLRGVVTALKTAGMVERIGDYTKNIAKRTAAISQAPPLGPTRAVARMGALAQGMIKNVLDAYVARDAERAEDVRRRDEEVDELHTSLFRELLTYMMEDSRNITPSTHLLFVAKNIERIGDHATNIAENIQYLVTGELPADKRPKGDASSYTAVVAEA